MCYNPFERIGIPVKDQGCEKGDCALRAVPNGHPTPEARVSVILTSDYSSAGSPHKTASTATRHAKAAEYIRTDKRRPTLVSIAILTLAAGTLVYVLDRPIHSARLIPEFLQFGGGNELFFGSVGSCLPSFLHIYCFVLLTVAILRPSIRGLWLICLAWFSIEALFEFSQQLEISAGALTWSRILTIPGSDWIRDYADTGVFDPIDLIALGAGALAAFVTAIIYTKKEGKDEKKKLA